MWVSMLVRNQSKLEEGPLSGRKEEFCFSITKFKRPISHFTTLHVIYKEVTPSFSYYFSSESKWVPVLYRGGRLDTALKSGHSE
jgi:hypothetical protein